MIYAAIGSPLIYMNLIAALILSLTPPAHPVKSLIQIQNAVLMQLNRNGMEHSMEHPGHAVFEFCGTKRRPINRRKKGEKRKKILELIDML